MYRDDLRKVTVQHSARKSEIEIARTQDEEVGDGTTREISEWNRLNLF